jgi:ribosomal protein L24E
MECNYCGSEVQKTEGKMLVMNSGEKFYFCSGKCEKNFLSDRSHDYQKREE